jgi:hypothetical protein
MKPVSIILLVIIVLLVLFVPAYAQDDGGSTDDNECLTGGVMEGKCTSDWHWICGWYLDNWFDKGGWLANPPTDFPDWCNPRSLLPPPPEPDKSSFPSGGCVYNGPFYNDYSDFKGGWSLGAPSTVYGDAGCTSPIFTWFDDIVYAPAPFDANALCQAAFGSNVIAHSAPSDVYVCG